MRPRAALLFVAIAAAAALPGCSQDLPPRSLLADARVLAVFADPLDLGPGESVTVKPLLWLPPGDAVATQRWTFCPFTLGASSAYACVLPQCEVALDVGPDGGATAAPTALAEQCLEAVRASGTPPPAGVPAQLPPRVDTVFRYTVATRAGTVREAVQLVPFFAAGPPAPRNVAPVIQRVEIGGVELAPGGAGPALRGGAELEVRVVLDPASAQAYADELGNPAVESLVVSYFTTAAKFDRDRADGPDARQLLKGEDLGGASEAEIWVVARDLRGGQAASGPYRVPIAR